MKTVLFIITLLVLTSCSSGKVKKNGNPKLKHITTIQRV